MLCGNRAKAWESTEADPAAFMVADLVDKHFRCWYRIQLRYFEMMACTGTQKRPIRK